jgi:osmoprotectant transport system ATP-binding protein
MVNRLVEPSAGQILLNGRDIAEWDVVALRRSIGYVIQQVGLFPHQTIADNVATVPRLLKWPKWRIESRVDQLLDLVGLVPSVVRDRYPSQLSGGERQRVGVARAMAAEPPLMLMDEPFGAVDPIVRGRLQDEFLQLQRRLGTTVLFVTHDVDEALKLGSRIVVFREGGRLAQYAPPQQLLAQPVDDYVAQFVGADRALKRLSLMTVSDVQLRRLETPAPAAPRVSSATSLRDALSFLLDAPGQEVVVDDRDEGPGGLLTIDALIAALHTPMEMPIGDADPGVVGTGSP